jgi:hypothetical protein
MPMDGVVLLLRPCRLLPADHRRVPADHPICTAYHHRAAFIRSAATVVASFSGLGGERPVESGTGARSVSIWRVITTPRAYPILLQHSTRKNPNCPRPGRNGRGRASVSTICHCPRAAQRDGWRRMTDANAPTRQCRARQIVRIVQPEVVQFVEAAEIERLSGVDQNDVSDQPLGAAQPCSPSGSRRPCRRQRLACHVQPSRIIALRDTLVRPRWRLGGFNSARLRIGRSGFLSYPCGVASSKGQPWRGREHRLAKRPDGHRQVND